MLNFNDNDGIQNRYLGYPIKDIIYSEEEKEKPIIKALEMLYEYICNSNEYCSLQGKTQVLNIAVSNLELCLTTRLIHDMHVSQTAMKIASFLRLPVEDILKAKIMGIAHDIGHIAFGHKAEAVLAEEMKKIGKGYNFSHAEYSECIFDKLYDECMEKIKHFDFFDDNLENYLRDLKTSMKKGVKNHPKYYGYKDENEEMAQKCVRLADTISFMVTDLSDLMRTKSSKGKPILSIGRVLDEIEKIGIKDKESYEEVIRILQNGGGELVKLHEKVIEEAFSTKRRENVVTIIDDYKLLQNIIGSYERGDLLGSFKFITKYYNYLKKHKNMARENNEFLNIVSSSMECISDREAFNKMRILCNKIDKIKKGELDENIFTIGEKEVIKRVSENVKENVERQTKNIQKSEFELCPTLMMLFTIQDKIQYQEILGRDSEVLENNEKQVEVKVRNRFQKVLKMAYIAYENPEEYCINGESPDLRLYRGLKVPKTSLKSYPPIDFAVYAVQQMQNRDFDSEDIINEMADNLGIKKEKRREIEDLSMKNIYRDVPRLYNRFKVKEIFLGENDISSRKEQCYQSTDVISIIGKNPEINFESLYLGMSRFKKLLLANDLPNPEVGRDE